MWGRCRGLKVWRARGSRIVLGTITESLEGAQYDDRGGVDCGCTNWRIGQATNWVGKVVAEIGGIIYRGPRWGAVEAAE